MADTSEQSTLAKLVGVVAMVAATFVATQVVNQVWRAAVGHKPPKADDEGDSGIGEIVVAAAVTGATAAIARALATRGTATYAARASARRSLSAE